MNCSQDDNSTRYGHDVRERFLQQRDGQNSVYFVAGGTSASTPSFAGMLTLLAQKYGNLGNVNPTLYNLALSHPSVFHDTTSGNNIVPCTVLSTDAGLHNRKLWLGCADRLRSGDRVGLGGRLRAVHELAKHLRRGGDQHNGCGLAKFAEDVWDDDADRNGDFGHGGDDHAGTWTSRWATLFWARCRFRAGLRR